jgi:hypothetical protein
MNDVYSFINEENIYIYIYIYIYIKETKQQGGKRSNNHRQLWHFMFANSQVNKYFLYNKTTTFFALFPAFKYLYREQNENKVTIL